MHTTLKAMKRVSEIRERREKQFYENRMKEAGKKKNEYDDAIKDLKEGYSLVAAPKSLTEKREVFMLEAPEPIKKNQAKVVEKMED